MITFPNVASMVADTGLSVGDYCSTAGYYTPGDGGGNAYEIVAAASGMSDDGSFIDLSGVSGQAKGLFPNGASVLQWGAAMDKTADDTTATQAAIEYTSSHAGFLSGGKVNHDARQSVIDQLTFTGAGATYDLDQIVLRCESGAARNSAVQLKLGQGSFEGVTVASAFDPGYQTGVHRYTNNLNSFYAGREKFSNLTISGFKTGLTIGGLASQGLVTYDQGTTQSDGIATDAPVSEEYYHGVDIQDCVVGLYFNQPNGKVTFSNSNINTEPLGWIGAHGSAPFTPTAITVPQGEVTILGGAVEAVQASGGILMDLWGFAHVNVVGATIEANASPVWMEGGARLRMSNIQNWGLNGDSPFVLVHSGWHGDLVCSDMFMLRTAGYSGGQSVIKAASSRSGSFLPNLNGRVSFSNVEFGDCNFGEGALFNPLCAGVDAEFSNCVLTSGHISNGSYIRDTAHKIDTSCNILRGVVDLSNATIPAFGANGGGAHGGWTFSSGGGGSNQWGKETSGQPSGHWGNGGASLKMSTTASGAFVEVATPNISTSPDRVYILKGLMKSNGSSAQITVRARGADNSVYDIYQGAVSNIPSSWSPVMFHFISPKNAASIRLHITVQDGAGIELKNMVVA